MAGEVTSTAPDRGRPRVLSGTCLSLLGAAVLVNAGGAVVALSSGINQWDMFSSGAEPVSTAEFLTTGYFWLTVLTVVLVMVLVGALRYRRGFLRVSANANYLRRLPAADYQRVVINGSVVIWSLMAVLVSLPFYLEPLLR